MGECNRRLRSWWSSLSSSSSWVLLIMVPLVAVLGSAALLCSMNSNWIFTSHYPWQWKLSTMDIPSSPSATIASAPSSSPTKEDETHQVFDSQSSNDYAIIGFSSSSPLPLSVPTEKQQPEGKKEGILKTPLNGPHSNTVVPSMDDTHSILIPERSRKNYSNLERVEASLGCARAAIRDAKDEDRTNDPDYTPRGPMYWNATAFYRSYVEMEKKLKVFVYEEGEPPVFHYGPCKSTYAIEGLFIQAMEISEFRTRDPDEAHLYFLPFSVTMITQVVYVVDSHEWTAMKNTAKDYVDVVAHKHPYWNRSLGADHFMLACHDWGPEISFAIPNLYNNSIRALCNANTSEQFNPSRDVSIPEIHLPTGTTAGMLGGPSPSSRPVLVFYAGGVHGPIRPILLHHWENKDPDVQVHQYLPAGVSYYDMMRKSKFCICPSGYEVASPRMVEGLYMGCVPVLIKDHYVIPFSDVLNWKAFAVVVPVEEIPNLKKILVGISQTKYLKMQRRGKQVRRHFEVNSPPKRFDVFHMILHSVWLRRLNVRVRDV